jgi:hypothetical protein
MHMCKHRSLIAAAAVLLFAAPLAAQGIRPDSTVRDSARVTPSIPAATSNVSAALPSLAPKQANVTAGVRSLATAPAPLAPPHPTSGSGSAMMVFGGAALLVGAVVGGPPGEIVMVVGGTIGLVGLWNYLNGAP